MYKANVCVCLLSMFLVPKYECKTIATDDSDYYLSYEHLANSSRKSRENPFKTNIFDSQELAYR